MRCRESRDDDDADDEKEENEGGGARRGWTKGGVEVKEDEEDEDDPGGGRGEKGRAFKEKEGIETRLPAKENIVLGVIETDGRNAPRWGEPETERVRRAESEEEGKW